MKKREQEQIKIDGIYYTVTWDDRKLLQDMEASLYGCCTTEGVKEFQKAIQDIKNRSTERDFEFDVYLTNYTDLDTDSKKNLHTDSVFKKFTDWVITHKRSVFLESDLSIEDKKKILYNLNISTNMLYE